MERTRRDVLGLAGVSVTALTAGCLDDTDSTTDMPVDRPSETPTDQSFETPADPVTDGQLPAGLERVDEPPYEITVPECEFPKTPTPSERDDLYLCANMPAEPSLSFEQASARGSVLADAGLELGDQTNSELFATLLTKAADRDRLSDDVVGDPGELIAETAFDTHAVLVVETGWGSGSVYPHIKRVEATDTGVRAFGCHSDPCVQTADYSSRTAAVHFEQPDTLETGVVSLTVAPDERWNAATGEGVVAIPDR